MGWGVFAGENIPTNQEITRNPADPFTAGEWENIKKSKFGPFVFLDKKNYKAGINNGFIAWGMITKINHSDNPNAVVTTTKVNGHMEAILTALKPIKWGEQIFIRYTNRNDSSLYPWH